MTPQINRLLVVGQAPPPLGGQALQIQRLASHSFEGFELIFIPMRFAASASDMGRPRLQKVVALGNLIVQVRDFARNHPGSVLYYPPSPPTFAPTIRDVLFLICVRRHFRETIIALHASGQRYIFGLNRFTRAIARAVYGRPRVAILNTPDAVPDAQALQARRLFIVPLGIPDPGEPPMRQASCENTLHILSVGHVSGAKGSVDLVEAFSMLDHRGLSLMLHFVGPFGPDLTEGVLRERAQSLGIGDRVRIYGEQTGRPLNQMYRLADIFAFPTRFNAESLGLVAIEAMSHGLPVVASRWRGVPYVVDEGVTGLLHEPGDISGIADGLERLVVDPQLRLQMGLASRERFLSVFSENRYWNDLELAILAAFD